MKFVLFLIVLVSGKGVQSILDTLNVNRFPIAPVLSNDNSTSICKRVYSMRTSHYVPYMETYRKHIYHRLETRVNYRKEYHTTWKTENVCCEGYTQFRGMCIARCVLKCDNGFCYKPNICHCYSGYSKLATKPDNICVPVCENDCIQGICTNPNVCTCHDGYKLDADGFTCIPDCNGTCSEIEYCAEPNNCQCITGYKRFQLTTEKSMTSSYAWNFSSSKYPYEKEHEEALTTFPTISIPRTKCVPVCDQPCVNGDCIAPNVCQCYEGYAKDEDIAFTCDPICVKSCQFGTCSAPNTCTCDEGYGPSKAHGSHICEPVCSEPCLNGVCVAPESCSCFDDYVFLNDSKYNCEPICNQTCENGRCTHPGVCTCNPGYEKNTTDETCIFQCECTNGFCFEPNTTCHCHDGFSLIDANNVTYCAPKCDNGCINGNCIAPEVCECRDDYILVNDTNGNVSCINPCETCANGICLAQEKMCQCYYGWSGDNCDDPYLCSLEINETLHRHVIKNNDKLFIIDHNNNSVKSVHFPWNLQSCSEQCLSKINNMTDCYSLYQNNLSIIICLLSTELECNAVDLASEEKYKTSKTSLVIGIIIFVLGTASAAAVILIRKQRNIKRQNQFAKQRINDQQREATHCLLEDVSVL